MKRITALILLCLISGIIQAAEKSTADVRVSLISAWNDTGEMLIQTSPNHDISGLNCTSNFWMIQYPYQAGYDVSYDLLLEAYRSQRLVTVTVNDENSGDFCKLTRVTIK